MSSESGQRIVLGLEVQACIFMYGLLDIISYHVMHATSNNVTPNQTYAQDRYSFNDAPYLFFTEIRAFFFLEITLCKGIGLVGTVVTT